MKNYPITATRDFQVGKRTIYKGDVLIIKINPFPITGDLIHIYNRIEEYQGQDESLVKGVVFRLIREIEGSNISGYRDEKNCWGDIHVN